MTVSTLNTKHVYDCNGIQTEWPYTFPIIASTDIAVYVTDLTGAVTKITSNFSVDTENGKVIYPTVESELDPAVVVANGFKVTIKRETPLTQEIDLVNEGALNAETLETGYDKSTMQVQQMQETLDRCVKYSVDQTPTDSTTATFLSSINSAKADAIAAKNAAQAAQTGAEAAQAIAEGARDSALSYASTAQSHATTATDQADIATTQAGIATTKAGEALTSANNAATSESNAQTYKNTAETAASTATAQAGIATAQAGIATTQAGNAATSANNAAASESAAAASAALAAAYVGREGAYEELIAMGGGAQRFFGYVTSGNYEGMILFYTGNPAKGDRGFIIMGGVPPMPAMGLGDIG